MCPVTFTLDFFSAFYDVNTTKISHFHSSLVATHLPSHFTCQSPQCRTGGIVSKIRRILLWQISTQVEILQAPVYAINPMKSVFPDNSPEAATLCVPTSQQGYVYTLYTSKYTITVSK